MRHEDASKLELDLEDEAWARGLRGTDVSRWRASWNGIWYLYPYTTENRSMFSAGDRTDGIDALDFDSPLDSQEEGILRRFGRTQRGLERLIDHRGARGLLQFQRTARYLSTHYDQLSNREFKGKNIRSFGRKWYEYIWPRTPTLMLAKGKIVTPRLVRAAEFALDSAGLLPQDSLISLALSKTGPQQREYEEFREALAGKLGGKVRGRDVVLYCLGILNSRIGTFLLTAGRQRTPRGSFTVNEAVLSEIPLPLPTAGRFTRILELVSALSSGRLSPSEERRREEQLNKHAYSLFDLAGEERIAIESAVAEAESDAQATTGATAQELTSAEELAASEEFSEEGD